MSQHAPIQNERGSVLVISIVILALLTVIGIAATSTTSIELQIAGNDRVYKENFYQADGAAMMLARVLENINTITGIEKLKEEQPKFRSPSGEERDVVKPYTNNVELEDIANPRYWQGGADDQSCEIPGIAAENSPIPMGIVSFPETPEETRSGDSLDMGRPSSRKTFHIFGRRAVNNNAVVIAIGYRKRY